MSEIDERARMRVVVHGQVQGTGFRALLAQLADQYSIHGYARNRADNSMEASFEGDPKAVEAMVAFCNEGPDEARVTRIDEIEEQPLGVAGFKVM